MYQRAEEDMETVHIYVCEDVSSKPTHRIWDRAVQVLAMGMLSAFCLIPSVPPAVVKTITVPAQFLPLQTVSVQTPIIPTGKHMIPATLAYGVLTIYNGSIFTQAIPQGFTLMSSNGIEIRTDALVQVPPGNAPDYGRATVSAHAVLPGRQGNIAMGSVNTVYGAYITIKNLSAFQGGQDTQTEAFTTAADRTTALRAARERLTLQKPIGLLARPCTETSNQQGTILAVTWSCQYVTYTAPAQVKVLSARVEGTHVVLLVSTVLPQ